MPVQENIARDSITFDDLRALAHAEGPCTTAVVVIPNPVELTVRLKNAIRQIEMHLSGHGINSAGSTSLLAPIHNLADDMEARRIWANALVLFRSPELFQYYFLYGPFQDRIETARQFWIKPVLPVVAREQRFHLLGLSRHNTRLYRGTQHTLEETKLDGFAPRDLREWMNTKPPDHVLDNRMTAGPSVGAMKGVVFSTNSDREREDAYLRHFFRDIDKGVLAILRNRNEPLVLAGVEYEIAIYRSVSAYPRLIDEAVTGSPEGLSDRELHERARELVMQVPSSELNKALSEFERLDRQGRTLFDLREIPLAAIEGRVAELFISDAPREDIDLILNGAAISTLRRGGRAFALNPAQMPRDSEAAAVLRF